MYSWRIISISIHLRFHTLGVSLSTYISLHYKRDMNVFKDSFIAPNFFAILISIDISIQIHQFVCIKLAYIKFGYYLTFKLTC